MGFSLVYLMLGTKQYWKPFIIQTLSRDPIFPGQDIFPWYNPKDSTWWGMALWLVVTG